MEMERARDALCPGRGCALSPGREAGLGLARSAMARYPKAEASWHYEHGLFLGAAMRAGEAWGDGALGREASARAASLVSPEGTIKGYATGEYNLDMVASGRNLFDLLAETGEPRFRTAIETLEAQLRSQPRTPSGGLWHKLIYPDQMWLDGLFMAQPFQTLYATRFERPDLLGDVVFQFSLLAGKAKDPRNGLLRHAWDERRTQLWADPETGRSPNHWGRAMGWFAMALVDVIELLPAGYPGRAELGAIAAGLAEALLAFQDGATGLWYQVVDQGSREGNYLEASVSSMLAYAFLKGSRLGALEPGRFLPAARRAYEGCCERFLRRDEGGGIHLEGICAVAGLGGSPYRDGSFEYYAGEPLRTDDFKGVGPFVLASAEYGRAGYPR